MERKCKKCSADISHKKPSAVFCNKICGSSFRRLKWYERKKIREAESLTELFPKNKKLEEEIEALEFFEVLKWHDSGMTCPHCNSQEKFYRLVGKSCRLGLWKCAKCKKEFTCRQRTILEDSPLPYRFWKVILEQVDIEAATFQADNKFCHRLDSMLGTTRKTSLFIKHRLENEKEFTELKITKKTCDRMVRMGLLNKIEDKYFITEKGKMWQNLKSL